jgi:hypothetical protein
MKIMITAFLARATVQSRRAAIGKRTAISLSTAMIARNPPDDMPNVKFTYHWNLQRKDNEKSESLRDIEQPA